MQPFEAKSEGAGCEREGAALLMELVPLVMRAVRIAFYDRRVDLSVVQFRALAFIDLQPGVSLSAVAEHVGLTLPTMSRMVKRHVAQQLLKREESPTDRRRVTLRLTVEGKALLEEARRIAQACLIEVLGGRSAEQLAVVRQGAEALLPLFTPGRGAGTAGSVSAPDRGDGETEGVS